MEIGYSEKTLWKQIAKAELEIHDESDWLNHYIATGEIEFVEDCVRNIEDSLTVIRECLALLKGKEM